MSKEKLKKIVVYSEKLKSKLQDKPSDKQSKRPVQYKEFLERELKAALSKAEALKMSEK